jgi:hypothetical protein
MPPGAKPQGRLPLPDEKEPHEPDDGGQEGRVSVQARNGNCGSRKKFEFKNLHKKINVLFFETPFLYKKTKKILHCFFFFLFFHCFSKKVKNFFIFLFKSRFKKQNFMSDKKRNTFSNLFFVLVLKTVKKSFSFFFIEQIVIVKWFYFTHVR